MQIVSTDSFRAELVSHDITQSHSGLTRLYLSLANSVVPKSLPEFLVNPACFNGEPH